MGKGNPFSFRRSNSSSSSTPRRRRTAKKVGESPLLLSQNTPSPSSPANAGEVGAASGSGKPAVVAVAGKPKKKTGGARLWMRFDRFGESELFECDKSTIIKRVGIPARDLRILGPVFSNSSNILAREKAMVVNLEYIKAIVTAEEVLLLDPLRQEVLPFVDQLRHQLSHKSHFNTSNTQGERQLAIRDTESNLPASGQWLAVPETAEGLQAELPFEFQVLEVALEVVCTYLDSSVADLERNAYPVLDELAKNVSTKNLEHVRSLKSNLTRLLARVQKELGTNRLIGTGFESHGLYRLSSLQTLTAHVCDSRVREAHCRLGHPLTPVLRQLRPDFNSVSDFHCESCQLGKHTRRPYPPRESSRVSSLFQLLHSDVWGPCPV